MQEVFSGENIPKKSPEHDFSEIHQQKAEELGKKLRGKEKISGESIDKLDKMVIVSYMMDQNLEKIEAKDKGYDMYDFETEGVKAGMAIIDKGYIRFNVYDSKNPIWEINSQDVFGRDSFYESDLPKLIASVKKKVLEYANQ